MPPATAPLPALVALGSISVRGKGRSSMFTRLRCLLRLHRWQFAADDGGGSHLRCGNCSKSKRGSIHRSTSAAEDVGGYGNVY